METAALPTELCPCVTGVIITHPARNCNTFFQKNQNFSPRRLPLTSKGTVPRTCRGHSEPSRQISGTCFALRPRREERLPTVFLPADGPSRSPVIKSGKKSQKSLDIRAILYIIGIGEPRFLRKMTFIVCPGMGPGDFAAVGFPAEKRSTL